MNDKSHTEKPHVIPVKVYLAVAAALLMLTAVTVGVSFIHLGGWNAVVAVGIASVKALLVAFIFMHLWYDKKIYLVIFSVALLFLTVFIALTMFDTLQRGDIYTITDRPIDKNDVIYKEMQTDSLAPIPVDDSLVSDSVERP
jgi:cytochrome c oxidase subunit 4